MKVGFIGLGTMGSSMALNVRAAGYDIFVNDIRREAGAAHLQAGVTDVDGPAAFIEPMQVMPVRALTDGGNWTSSTKNWKNV